MKKTNRLLSGVIAFAIVLGMFVMPLNAAAGPDTLQPAEGERIPVLTSGEGGAGIGGLVQKPSFTENGDGTYAVVSGHEGWYESFTDSKSEGQFTNQSGSGWNYYFPRVYYPDGVKAVELAWGLMSITDAADLADYEIYYSSDAVKWTKTTAFTTYLYNPQNVGGAKDLGASNGSQTGVRFIFDAAIEAKYFFAYDPSPAAGNIQHWSGYFVACEAPKAALPAVTASIKDSASDGKIDHLYLIAAISASETRQVGIIFSDSKASCEAGAKPLFIRVAEEGHGKSADGFIQSGCYGGHVITAANLGGEEGDSVIAVYWQEMPTNIGTLYARTFAKNSDGTYDYGAIATIALSDGAQVLPIK